MVHITVENGECDPQFAPIAAAGVDFLIGSVVFQRCFVEMAPLYPNTTFLSYAAFGPGPPNYASLWPRTYQLTYLACLPLPAATLDLAGFCQGARAANPAAEIHVFGTGALRFPLMEVWIVNQSYALGCDVVWVQSVGIEGTQWASQLGLMSVGLFSDARLTVGETVITSIVVDFTPLFVRAAEAILSGTFQNEMQKADLWMGWEGGAMVLADFSFLVPPAVQARVRAQIPTLDRIFCGHVCTQTQCLCNSSTCCLTDAQLTTLQSTLDFVLDHGLAKLPGEACLPGQLATWRLDTFTMQCSACPAGTHAHNEQHISECLPCPASTCSLPGSTSCTSCPAGTYSDSPGQGRCLPCPPGSIAPSPAAVTCSACSSSRSNADRTQCELPSALWISLFVTGVVTFLTLVGVCLLWAARRRSRRNNAAAPKDPAQPFCVMFTDVQGSTCLWAAIPDVMAAALDTHHALIRRLIAMYECYEVKTIGDSFMCATPSPSQAVRFALALQAEFVRHNWGTDAIDRAYTELTTPEAEAPGCWNGLRVRTGIHYGCGDIKLDPVSRGYDYYGPVVNAAARIESVCHGGQTAVSAAVFEALGGHCPGAVWADLGLQPLRGLTEPLRLYQVLPEGPLAKRQFPPLRVDRLDDREAALSERTGSTATAGRHGRHRPTVAPTGHPTSLGSSGDFAEHHPLIAQGRISAADLHAHHRLLKSGLAALLAPLAMPVRQRAAKELCAHFHVPNHGTDGPLLQQTLDGLVQRALPATVLPRSARWSSLPVLPTGAARPGGLRPPPAPGPPWRRSSGESLGTASSGPPAEDSSLPSS